MLVHSLTIQKMNWQMTFPAKCKVIHRNETIKAKNMGTKKKTVGVKKEFADNKM